MKTYGPVKVEMQTACIRLVCDACKSEADYPEAGAWEWGGAGVAHGEVVSSRTIDGDWDGDRVDLCFDCAESLIDAIRKRGRAAWTTPPPS